MSPQNRDCVEYDWNEHTGMETRTFEDPRDGAISFSTRYAPLAKPAVTPELKASYEANLLFWLKTQPQENYR